MVELWALGITPMKKHKKAIFGLALLLFAIAMIVLVLATRTEAPRVVYVVKSGDTLFRICKMHKVALNDVINANGLGARQLRVGQEIVIPNPPLLVRLGRSLDKVAAKVGIGNPPFERMAYNVAGRKSK